MTFSQVNINRLVLNLLLFRSEVVFIFVELDFYVIRRVFVDVALAKPVDLVCVDILLQVRLDVVSEPLAEHVLVLLVEQVLHL